VGEFEHDALSLGAGRTVVFEMVLELLNIRFEIDEGRILRLPQFLIDLRIAVLKEYLTGLPRLILILSPELAVLLIELNI